MLTNTSSNIPGQQKKVIANNYLSIEYKPKNIGDFLDYEA
jgi:hypothetical protein